MLSKAKHHNATCYSSLVKTEDWVMLGYYNHPHIDLNVILYKEIF